MGVRCSPVSSYPLLRRAVNGQMRQTLAESFGKACKSRNILNARRAFRVAAPSIRIVPWAALASCWPLPQQLLPVSATGGGRRCCSGRIFLFWGSEKPAGFSEPLFHGQRTPSVIACGDATFPKGTAFSGSDKASGSAQRLPLGGAGALAPEGVTPPVKMQSRSVRRRSGFALLKIIFPLMMRRAQRSAFQIIPLPARGTVQKSPMIHRGF